MFTRLLSGLLSLNQRLYALVAYVLVRIRGDETHMPPELSRLISENQIYNMTADRNCGSCRR